MFHRLRKLNFRSIVKKIVFAAKKLAQEMKGVDGSFPALPKVAMARYCGSVTFRMATRLQEGQKHKGLNETNTKIKEKMIISLSKSDILVYYQMSCNFNRYFLFNSICPGKWVQYSEIAIESVFGEKLQTILCKYISHGTATYRQAIWFQKKNEVSFQ